ncbi:hypothetical protein OAL67_00555 [bacterium]|nr:hypothetical protein [bacterium]
MRASTTKIIAFIGIIMVAFILFAIKDMGLSLGEIGGWARTVIFGIFFLVAFFIVIKTVFRG